MVAGGDAKKESEGVIADADCPQRAFSDESASFWESASMEHSPRWYMYRIGKYFGSRFKKCDPCSTVTAASGDVFYNAENKKRGCVVVVYRARQPDKNRLWIVRGKKKRQSDDSVSFACQRIVSQCLRRFFILQYSNSSWVCKAVYIFWPCKTLIKIN